MERREMRMISWRCGVSLNETQTNLEWQRRIGVNAIGDVMRTCADWTHRTQVRCRLCRGMSKLVVDATAPLGRPENTPEDCVS